MKFRSAADLKVGERAIIRDLSFDDVPMKLLEMGCLPGMEMELKHVAPFKDPMYIRVADYHLAIRRDMAEKILLENP